MKVPFSWLKDYVDIDCSIDELVKKLFSCGFEVEEVINLSGSVDKIVSCKILEITKHPNADKLSVTKVDAGKYGKLQIITAATNIFVGAVVPVALDGSTLYNGTKINTGDLRGMTSYGMFCSGEEFGINDDFYKGASVNGILILDEKYPLGEEVKDLIGLNDYILDINVTANRPDCQSIVGIAREVAAILNKKFKMPDLSYNVDKNVSTKNTVKVSNKSFDLCPRYISHYVTDIKLAESPSWLKKRLFLMGLRSINNIVDITNYVLLEIGQPMHAFDLDNLEGKEIVVRRALNNEKIITLDEKEFTLSKNNLVICDKVKPVALAGIMGGLNSEIKDTTKEILFESAKFKRDNIRKSSRTLGQRSDSSSRFEKGVDAYTTEIGMKRALNLIDKLGCGKIACDEYDLYEELPEKKVIKTTFTKINNVLGIEVKKDIIENILKNLDFEINSNGDNIEVTAPLYREDVESYPDIAEEVIREYGYDNLVPTLLKGSSITSGGRNEEQTNIDKIKDLFVGFGFNEIITYSFVSEKDYELFDIEKNNLIKIINPIGEDISVMRQSLLPSVVKIACNNINRKNFEGRIFEFAKTYFAESVPLNKFAIENRNLSFAMFGENENYFTAKGVVESLLNAFCFDKEVRYIPCDKRCMHPTRSASIIIEGKNVGYFGQVNPIICGKLDIDKPVYAGEIFYEELKGLFNSKIVFKNISKFPQVERDLAIVLDKSISSDRVYNCIKSSAGEFLESIKLFDIYEGDQIAKDKKSMAFNLIFVSNDRTLSVEEIDSSIKNILLKLREELKAELR